MKDSSSPSFHWIACAIALACFAGLTACGGEESPTEGDVNSSTESGVSAESGVGPQDAAELADTGILSGDVKSYGADLASDKVITVDELLDNRHSYQDQTVAVRGLVVGVCAKRGCWINIGGSDGKAVRFKVNDGEMVFPMTAKGNNVVAEGVWTRIYYSVEQLREMEAKRAAEAGEEFDPETITEPYLAWQLKGLGAKIDA